MTTKKIDYRFAALWRFGAAISLLTILGHAWLGFEQSWAQPLVALATAYTLELLLETIDARATERMPRYLGGGLQNFASFMLPAHITALAVTMLTYANELLWPVVMGTAIAIGSKYILRVRVGERTRHFLNPSNTGVALMFLLTPWVSIAPPWQYTENVSGLLDWIIPGVIILTGSFLNYKFTKKLPLLAGWIGGYLAQGVVRLILFDAPLTATLMPMTGLAFILFTFYMISDPGTTPFAPKLQVAFGFSVAAVYGVFVSIHIVFGLFFALLLVCSVRGLWIFAQSLATIPMQTSAEVRQPATTGGD